MAIKNALIVDDSKSARAVLRRMLEEFNLIVETVDSADEAINFLKTRQPDAIFMDHMMPGMDGFEAVKHIKNNPQTANIPIMMYTSRGGEVYLSRARALGAVGIISKTISPVGLKESLFKLGLLDDRRREERRNPAEVIGRPHPGPDGQAKETGLPDNKKDYKNYLNDLNRLMDEQTIELHKSMWLSVESVSNEIFNRLNSDLQAKFEKLFSAMQQKKQSSWPLYVIAILLVISLFFNAFLLALINIDDTGRQSTIQNQNHPVANLKNSENNAVYAYEADDNTDAADTASPVMSVNNQALLKSFNSWAHNKTIEFPFDELALNDNRLPAIDEIIQKAADAGYHGDILLQTHIGQFCLSRDETGNHKLADDDMPVTQCDYIGNYLQPTDLSSTHQSLSFANYLSDNSMLNNNDIEIEVTNLERTIEIVKYPDQKPETTAKEWNRVAQENNRISVKLIPESSN